MRSRVSRPSIPGTQISSSTTSLLRFFSRSTQASPLSASSTLYPSSSRIPRSDSRISRSSSTTRTLCILFFGLCHVYRQRKFHNELGPGRFIFFYADRAVMVLNDSAHNRQAQARPALFGREVRKEQFFFNLAVDSVAGVGDQNF